MKQLVGLVGMLLASSAGAEQSGYAAMHGHDSAAGPIYQTSTRHKPAPKLTVTITPSKVKIDDTSRQGTLLATVAVSWSNRTPYTGTVKLTKNPGGICRLVGMEVQLGRDATTADDFTTFVCTVTAIE